MGKLKVLPFLGVSHLIQRAFHSVLRSTCLVLVFQIPEKWAGLPLCTIYLTLEGGGL